MLQWLPLMVLMVVMVVLQLLSCQCLTPACSASAGVPTAYRGPHPTIFSYWAAASIPCNRQAKTEAHHQQQQQGQQGKLV